MVVFKAPNAHEITGLRNEANKQESETDMEERTDATKVSKSELIEQLGCNDNERLARWQGNLDFSKYTLILQTATGYWPDYLNDDAAAMSLLDTLVEKGYGPCLLPYNRNEGWMLAVFDGEINTNYPPRPTRREAVCAAVLELIGKEGV